MAEREIVDFKVRVRFPPSRPKNMISERGGNAFLLTGVGWGAAAQTRGTFIPQSAQGVREDC